MPFPEEACGAGSAGGRFHCRFLRPRLRTDHSRNREERPEFQGLDWLLRLCKMESHGTTGVALSESWTRITRSSSVTWKRTWVVPT